MRIVAIAMLFIAITPRLFACDCAEVTVLWVDHADQRYFVSLDTSTQLSIRAKVYDLVGTIQTEQPDWLGNVRIAFLAKGASAQPHVPNAAEYLADYDQAASQLTFEPASSAPRGIEVFVSIPAKP